MIYGIGFGIFVVVAVVLGIVLKDYLNSIKFWLGLIVAFIVLFGIILSVSYYINKNFRSFDLSELKRQELIIQTIDFKKFLIQATDVDNSATASKYTDELQVYLVSGHANIAFTDIENLKADEEASDISKKIWRLNYNNPKKTIPFSIDVIINENDIYKVASFESEPVNILGLKKDLIKPEMSQAEKIEVVKEELKKEFEKQIIDCSNPKKLEESDLYQTFIYRLKEIITGMSDYKDIKIKFEN